MGTAALVLDFVAAPARAPTFSVTVLVSALAAMGALVVGVLNHVWQRRYQARQLELLRGGQRTDRFTRAVEQLSSTSVPVRMGGIFALERIGAEYPDDTRHVVDVLAAFVRERLPASRVGDGGYTTELGVRAADAQAALTVLTRSPLCDERVATQRPGLLDLSRTDLRRASLPWARLDGANLFAARLEGADLRHADLRRADLQEANLGPVDRGSQRFRRGADLSHADLTGAVVTGVHHLDDAVLDGVVGLDDGAPRSRG